MRIRRRWKPVVVSMEGLVLVIIIVFVGVAALGYGLNFTKLVGCDFEAPYKCETVHGIGLLTPPIGAVVGYLNMGK